MKRIYDSFARQGMMSTLGATLTHVSPGHTTIKAPIRPETCQQQGAAHAGLSFAIGDSAAGYAALTKVPEDQEVVTSEMKIHLLTPAIGDCLIAYGKVLRAGRRLLVVTAEVYVLQDDIEKQVAFLTGSIMPVDINYTQVST